MALALTDKFHNFYEQEEQKHIDAGEKARAILKHLVDAPWMSSGLTSNNAFTTTLVLRTAGLLIEEEILKTKSVDDYAKLWELELHKKEQVSAIAKKLEAHQDFLYLSLSDKAREGLQELSVHKEDTNKSKDLAKALVADLRRVTNSGWIYEDTRFPSLSDETKNKKEQAEKAPTVYKIAELNHLLLSEKFEEISKPLLVSLRSISKEMAKSPENFSINEYPSSAAVVYWFVDGISRAQVELSEADWEQLCRWASKEFHEQHSLVLANHDALMDPVSMAMAACLCARLRFISAEARNGMREEHRSLLPSGVELEHSIKELFKRQTTSGIWPKYFPLFHYQDAGSNFCFTFELLEAVLHEFGRAENKLLNDTNVIRGLEKAVEWCEANRLSVLKQDKRYTGWNSGGYLATLKKGHPESWATAVIHMFLWKLQNVLSQRIQLRLLEKYNAQPPEITKRDQENSHSSPSPLDRLLDVELLLIQEEPKLKSLREILKKLVDTHREQREVTLRRKPAKLPVSALLFGPPGTSKTIVTKAVADELQWPRIVINPSEFVKGTLANVYLQADEIFKDLADLSAVVVLFDEMDALTQSRAHTHLDTPTQFLTTTMLPKLTELHDKRRVVFFMATNYQGNFDPAIKRAGRFDLLLCMGPPTLSEKLNRLAEFVSDLGLSEEDIESVRNKLQSLTTDSWVSKQLGLYTYGEFMVFLKTIGDKGNFLVQFNALSGPTFKGRVKEYSKFVTLKLDDLPFLTFPMIQDLDDISLAKLNKVSNTGIGSYLLDRRESKRQY